MSYGGITNEARTQPFVAEDAIPNAGYILMPGTANQTAGLNLKVKLNDGNTEPIGIAYTSTKHPVTGVATANVQVGVTALIEGTEVEVPVVADNAKITQWDAIKIAADGKVDKKDGPGWIVGRALEAKEATTGGYIRIRVAKYNAAS
ncbi:MAG: hypothetical protein M0P69_11000 [Bacteroidales bacterium]|nr:hypothetical protein [Bacteroidales bacterium]